MAFLTSLTASVNTSTTTAAYDSATNGVKFVCGVLTSDNGGAAPSVSDNQGNTYNLTTVQAGSNPAWNRARLFYLRNPTTAASHTWTVSGNNCSMVVLLFTDDMDTTQPDAAQVSSQVGATTSMQPGSITPSAAGMLALSAGGHSFGMPSISIDLGFTKVNQAPFQSGVNYGSVAAYLYTTGTSALNPTWTFNTTSEGFVGLNIIFRTATAAATSKTFRPPTMRYMAQLVR